MLHTNNYRIYDEELLLKLPIVKFKITFSQTKLCDITHQRKIKKKRLITKYTSPD